MMGTIMDIKTDKDKITKIKKFLAFVLRHKPFFYKIKLDENGYADTDEIAKAVTKNLKIETTKQDIVDIAKKYSGGMFMCNKDNSRVSARDGHSFIFNMSIPEGFSKAESIPKILYALVSQKDFYNIFSSEVFPLSNKKVFLTEFKPNEAKGFTILTINTSKTMRKLDEMYYNSEEDLYFARFITTDSIVVHV